MKTETILLVVVLAGATGAVVYFATRKPAPTPAPPEKTGTGIPLIDAAVNLIPAVASVAAFV